MHNKITALELLEFLLRKAFKLFPCCSTAPFQSAENFVLGEDGDIRWAIDET